MFSYHDLILMTVSIVFRQVYLVLLREVVNKGIGLYYEWVKWLRQNSSGGRFTRCTSPYRGVVWGLLEAPAYWCRRFKGNITHNIR